MVQLMMTKDDEESGHSGWSCTRVVSRLCCRGRALLLLHKDSRDVDEDTGLLEEYATKPEVFKFLLVHFDAASCKAMILAGGMIGDDERKPEDKRCFFFSIL